MQCKVGNAVFTYPADSTVGSFKVEITIFENTLHQLKIEVYAKCH
jgi:hypothetical protein